MLRGGKVIARQPVEVTAASASVQGPASVEAGAPFEVRWTGPNYTADWLAIRRPTAADSDGAYGELIRADATAPGKLTAPVEPGRYELRYVLRGGKVIARQAVGVTKAVARLRAPARAVAGSSIEIGWSGPNYANDWLAIRAPQASDGDGAYGQIIHAQARPPGRLTAPQQPGDYELRYVLRGAKVIARRPLTVIPAK